MQPFYSILLSIPLSSLVSLGASAYLGLTAAAFEETSSLTRVSAVSARLTALEIQLRLAALPGWELEEEVLVYERTFGDFVGAIAFVNRLVQPAEQLGHHPEITINYNRVMLRLTTHDAGGLTALDFQLASKISQLLAEPEAIPEAND